MTTWIRLRPRAVLLVTAVVAIGCNGGGNPVDPGNNATFAATIDGASWSATDAKAVANAGGIFTLTGVEPGSGIGVSMTLYHIGAPATYALGVGNMIPGGMGTVVAGSSGWMTPLSGSAGTVTISAVSPTRIVGTFAFTAPPVPGQGAVGTRAVTAGRFDLPVTGPATLVVAANAGSTLSGTLAGQAFNASSIASIAPTAGVFSFAGSNIAQTLNILISDYTGVGTYALGSGVSRHIRLTNATAPTGTWGGTNATSSGTVTITSVTASRVKGTLTATLQPAPGFTGAPVSVTATFDLGI